MTPTQQADLLGLAVNAKRDFGASGSNQTTAGTILSGSDILTLANELDFQNGQGISIANAGPLPTISALSAPIVAVTGTAGTTDYAYAVAALDGNGGETAASPSTEITTGNAVLSTTNFNAISWTAVSGASCYAVYRTFSGGSPSTTGFLGLVYATTLDDTGLAVSTPPVGIAEQAPTGALGDTLTTSITSGGGTLTLTLSTAASSSVDAATVSHDDTESLQQAANNLLSYKGGKLVFPEGDYNTSGIQLNDSYKKIVLDGNGQSAALFNVATTATSSTSTVYLTGSGVAGDEIATLKDLYFEGNQTGGVAVWVQNISQGNLTNLRINNFLNQNYGMGINFSEYCFSWAVKNPFISNCAYAGIYLAGACNANQIIGGWIYLMPHGSWAVRMVSANGNQIIGTIIEQNAGGVLLEGNNNKLLGCWIEANGTGIYANETDSVIENCFFYNNTVDISVGPNSQNCIIRNCHFDSTPVITIASGSVNTIFENCTGLTATSITDYSGGQYSVINCPGLPSVGNFNVGGILANSTSVLEGTQSRSHILPASGGMIGLTNNAASNWGLWVQDATDPSSGTMNNIIDDGAGNRSTNPSTSSLAGTSGAIDWVQPERGTRKVFIAVAASYVNDSATDGVINFPTPFSNIPAVSINTTGLTVSVSTAALTITAPNTTTVYNGVIEVVGI